MDETKRTARLAGVLYLVLALSAPIGLMYVPGRLIVRGDATATADRIRASEWLLRVGIGSELFHQVIGILLVLVLYRLFKQVNQGHAVLLVVFSLAAVPIVFLNVLNEIAALILLDGPAFLSVFDRAQREAMAMLFLRMHGLGFVVASIFWGLWLFPFGMLVIRCGFIPRLFGVLLWVAGVAYLASAFATLVVPAIAPFVNRYALLLEVAEVPIIFWLLIRGARPGPLATASAPTGG